MGHDCDCVGVELVGHPGTTNRIALGSPIETKGGTVQVYAAADCPDCGGTGMKRPRPTMPCEFVTGETKLIAEVGKALGVDFPFSSLTLHMDVESIVSVTVEFYPMRDGIVEAEKVLRRYDLKVVPAPDAEAPR